MHHWETNLVTTANALTKIPSQGEVYHTILTIFYYFKVSHRSVYTQGKVIHKCIYTRKQEPQGSFYRGAITGDHYKMNKLIQA